MELPHDEAVHWCIQLRDHASVQPLSRFLEQRGQGLSGYEALGVTLNGQTVGAAVIERHGADAFVLVGKAADGTVVPGGAVHGTQAFVLRDGAVVVDKETSARLAALHTATLQGALRSVVGAAGA